MSTRCVQQRTSVCVGAGARAAGAGRVFERDGARVIVDDYSADKMTGATVDFSQELIKQAFMVVGNPNAQTGCGCGVSFDLKQA